MKLLILILLFITTNAQSKENSFDVNSLEKEVSFTVNFNSVKSNGKERKITLQDTVCYLDRIPSIQNQTPIYECYNKHEKKGEFKRHYASLEYQFEYYPERRTIKTLQVTIKRSVKDLENQENIFKKDLKTDIYRIPRIIINQSDNEIYRSLLNPNQEEDKNYSIEIIKK